MNGEKHEHGSHGGMGMRGVTRPMEEMKHHGDMKMSHDDRMHMLRMHHKQTLWIYWSIVLLGLWTMAAPWTLGYGSEIVQPGGGRDVWISDAWRVRATMWSDLLSGIGLAVFGWRALTPNRPISLWICCFIGLWMNLAPLLFWAPTAAAFLNGTLVGTLVMMLTVIIPGMPNMILYMKMGGDQPPGWTYNPSSWPQRSVLIALAFGGWIVSRYLGAHQLGYIDHAWDPFFGEGTRLVLNSDMSHMWPISDGAFGAFAYTIEFTMGWMGATSRWRTMPWMVTFFGILVIPLGLVHILLVASQPLVVGEWCTFCLLAAALMLPMIPLQVDEVIAMAQHMKQSMRNGESFWQVFWKGDEPGESTMDERSPEFIEFPVKPGKVTGASLWGMSFPWQLVVATLLGIAAMFVPATFGVAGVAANAFHLGGALVVVVAVIAMGEPIRITRYLNVALGLALAAAPWFAEGSNLPANLAATVLGLATAALSLPRGPIRENYGAWDGLVK